MGFNQQGLIWYVYGRSPVRFGVSLTFRALRPMQTGATELLALVAWCMQTKATPANIVDVRLLF